MIGIMEKKKKGKEKERIGYNWSRRGRVQFGKKVSASERPVVNNGQ